MLLNNSNHTSIFNGHKKTDILADNLDYLRPERSYNADALPMMKPCVQILIGSALTTIDFSASNHMTLGRRDAFQTNLHLFDLEPYDALQLGVSREHCQLTTKWGQLFVVDIGSTNGTMLNDRLLKPYQPYVITRNATLRLGRLSINFLSE